MCRVALLGTMAKHRERARDARWWLSDEPHSVVFGLVRDMAQRQSVRRTAYKRYAELYGVDQTAVGWAAVDIKDDDYVLTHNALANAVDTLQAKIIKNRPLPMFKTEGGTWSERTRAKKLGKFVEGQFAEAKVWPKMQSIVLDALVYGTGIAKVYERFGKVECDRVLPFELFVDDSEARYGMPRCIYHRSFYDRLVLAEMFPEHADAIENAPDATDEDDFFGREHSGDLVCVVEAWHLPSGPTTDRSGEMRKHDGHKIVCIGNATLDSCAWNREDFPFAFLSRNATLHGFWGRSLVKELAPAQREFEFITAKMQNTIRLMSVARFMAETGSVNPTSVTNEDGTFITYNGKQPVPVAAPVIAPDLYQYSRDLPRDMLAHSGISQMSANAQKAPGVTAAVAMNTLDDIESERFLVLHRRFEEFCIVLAENMVETAREIHTDDNEYCVRVSNKADMEVVSWADVDMARDKYVIEVFPISMLSKQPAARFQQLQDMFNAGAITVDQFKRLFEMPDLEAENELDTADVDVIDMNVDYILFKGEPISAEPFDKLQLIIERGGRAYNLARVRGVPESRLELLRRYLQSAHDLMERSKPQDAAPPAAPQMPPMMPPGMPGMAA